MGQQPASLQSYNNPLTEQFKDDFTAGTTSVEATDEEGWLFPSRPVVVGLACIAGNTGVGMSQRMQSFVLDASENPFNVVEPGKRPRVTLTPASR